MRPRPSMVLIALLAVTAFLLRFGSTWWLVLRGQAPRFDPHTFGLLGDFVLLSALAPFLTVLLCWILWRRGRWRGLLAPPSRPRWTVPSVVGLLLLGAPTPNQVWALVLLPGTTAWPALASAALWFGTAALLRALAVGGSR